MLTMGSLFDGIGGFPLAAQRHGIVPVWASEIEPFPIEVTKYHFPDMLHVGDITKLNGAELQPVDIICGGSPCQDLSVAGARAGLDGARSGLFMEQIRIIGEMRDADRKRGRTASAVRPRWAVWENVPGALSSGSPKASDFQKVIEAFAQIEEPYSHVVKSPTRRWEYAGAVLGIRSCLAWVTWNAQYFGVPQRRRRIFLVADFAGFSALQILFNYDSLLGDSETLEGEGETATAGSGTCADDTSGIDSGGLDSCEYCADSVCGQPEG